MWALFAPLFGTFLPDAGPSSSSHHHLLAAHRHTTSGDGKAKSGWIGCDIGLFNLCGKDKYSFK